MAFRLCRSSMVFFVLLCLGACSKAPEPQKEAQQPKPALPSPSVPDLKVSEAVKAKGLNPKPGAGAKKKTAPERFGKGNASVAVKDHPGGATQSFWTEELDVDGTGQPSLVDIGWDNRHKVLYTTRERSFPCRNGDSADGSVLTAVYGKGNALDRPPGSGWWVAELDASECGNPRAGLYGCRFDAGGNNTDCGSINILEATDDVEVMPLPQDQSPATPNTPPADSTSSGGDKN